MNKYSLVIDQEVLYLQGTLNVRCLAIGSHLGPYFGRYCSKPFIAMSACLSQAVSIDKQLRWNISSTLRKMCPDNPLFQNTTVFQLH